MIFLTSNVAHQIDAAKATANQADGQLAELELDDRSECKEDPHDGNGVAGDPKDE